MGQWTLSLWLTTTDIATTDDTQIYSGTLSFKHEDCKKGDWVSLLSDNLCILNFFSPCVPHISLNISQMCITLKG